MCGMWQPVWPKAHFRFAEPSPSTTGCAATRHGENPGDLEAIVDDDSCLNVLSMARSQEWSYVLWNSTTAGMPNTACRQLQQLLHPGADEFLE